MYLYEIINLIHWNIHPPDLFRGGSTLHVLTCDTSKVQLLINRSRCFVAIRISLERFIRSSGSEVLTCRTLKLNYIHFEWSNSHYIHSCTCTSDSQPSFIIPSNALSSLWEFAPVRLQTFKSSIISFLSAPT